MDQRHVTVYPSTKAYTRANGEIVRHVSNRRYVPKLRQYTDEECQAIVDRVRAGEGLTAVAAEYGLSYTRARSVLNRWQSRQSTVADEKNPSP